jgi:hypothetical protein
LPKQAQGLRQPIAHNPVRYTTNAVDNQATNQALNLTSLWVRQTEPTSNSITPTIKNSVRKETNRIGSEFNKAGALPKALIILAPEVINNNPPIDQRSVDANFIINPKIQIE